MSAFAAAFAGGTAYLVHTRAAASPPAAVAAVTAGPAAVAPPAAATPAAHPIIATPSSPALPAQAARPSHRAPEPDDQPLLDRTTIERTGLHRGPARGPADAPITIVVFTDLTCIHCGNALGTIDQLWDEYPGKLRLVMKQLPVRAAGALPAEAALAADAQGKFWELHDLMIAHQDDLSHDGVIALAARAGLDVAAFPHRPRPAHLRRRGQRRQGHRRRARDPGDAGVRDQRQAGDRQPPAGPDATDRRSGDRRSVVCRRLPRRSRARRTSCATVRPEG